MRIVFTKYIYILFIFLISKSLIYAQKSHDIDENEVEDLVPVKTLQIEGDFSYDNTNFNRERISITTSANAKWYSFPSLLFRYGIIKNVEIQAGTGYIGYKAKAKVNLKFHNRNLLNLEKNLSGLAPLSLGTKIGICPQKKSKTKHSFYSFIHSSFCRYPCFPP